MTLYLHSKERVRKIPTLPFSHQFSNIVNASKIHSGKLSSNKLGVKALDDYTLEINLKSADDGFLNVLATAVAMPCNKEFFYNTF